MKQDPWRERRRRQHQDEQASQQARIEGQRRWLESQLEHQGERERALAFDAALQALNQNPEPETVQTLITLLAAGGDAEQWRLLRQLCEALQGAQAIAQTCLLAVISARPERLLQAVAKSREQLVLKELDLSNLKFDGLNLRGATLLNCSFNQACLPRLDLYGAKLDGVSFVRAELNQAQLTGATLNQIDFTSAQLIEADLVAAELNDCLLNHADLTRANLRQSRWQGESLQDATLLDIIALPAALKKRLGSSQG